MIVKQMQYNNLCVHINEVLSCDIKAEVKQCIIITETKLSVTIITKQ